MRITEDILRRTIRARRIVDNHTEETDRINAHAARRFQLYAIRKLLRKRLKKQRLVGGGASEYRIALTPQEYEILTREEDG